VFTSTATGWSQFPLEQVLSPVQVVALPRQARPRKRFSTRLLPVTNDSRASCETTGLGLFPKNPFATTVNGRFWSFGGTSVRMTSCLVSPCSLPVSSGSGSIWAKLPTVAVSCRGH
jgi:hypothetical protein